MKFRARAAGLGLALVLAATAISASARNPGALISVRSRWPVAETIDRLEQQVTAAGFDVTARVDHAKRGAAVGLALRPTELLVFGNPDRGTPLMQCDQRVGIDLPLRALAWQDESAQVWLAITNPSALKIRYDIGPDCDKSIAAMEAAVRGLLAASID